MLVTWTGTQPPTANCDPPARLCLGSGWGSEIGEPAAVRSAGLTGRAGARHAATLPTPEGTCWLGTPEPAWEGPCFVLHWLPALRAGTRTAMAWLISKASVKEVQREGEKEEAFEQ